MAGQKTSKKAGPGPKPTLTRRICRTCAAQIMSNEIQGVLCIDIGQGRRWFEYQHRTKCPSV